MVIDVSREDMFKIVTFNLLENNKEVVVMSDPTRLSVFFWDTVSKRKKIGIDLMTWFPKGYPRINSFYSNVDFFEEVDANSITDEIMDIINLFNNRFKQNQKTMKEFGFETIGFELYKSGSLLISFIYEGKEQLKDLEPSIFIYSKLKCFPFAAPSNQGVIETLRNLPFDVTSQLNGKTRDLLIC